MAKTQQAGKPSVSPEVGIGLIKKQIERGKAMLDARPLDDNKYAAWGNTTREFLVKAFGAESPNVDAVMDMGRISAAPYGEPPEWWEARYAECLQGQVTLLESILELLETEVEISTPNVGQFVPHKSEFSRRVFLVHGHHEAIREATARFIEKLDLTPVILHEQPNKGRTIIEKFVDYSDVVFAIVLLTGDDRGGPIATPPEGQKPRARQNVILEFGFFLGKLTRARVCALYQEGVEIPSDYSGVLFVKLDDSGAWKLQVAKELKAAGIDVDMNKAL